jgi:hypothetical protein
VSKYDQAKLVMRARKLQKELQNEIIIVEAGDKKSRRYILIPMPLI